MNFCTVCGKKRSQYDCVISTVRWHHTGEMEGVRLDSFFVHLLRSFHCRQLLPDVLVALKQLVLNHIWIWWNETHPKQRALSCLGNNVLGVLDNGDFISRVDNRGCWGKAGKVLAARNTPKKTCWWMPTHTYTHTHTTHTHTLTHTHGTHNTRGKLKQTHMYACMNRPTAFHKPWLTPCTWLEASLE